MSGISSAICDSFPKSVGQARPSQPRSAQSAPHSSGKKASTDLLADIGGDPFAAPQVAPAFAAFPAYGSKLTQGTNLSTVEVPLPPGPALP